MRESLTRTMAAALLACAFAPAVSQAVLLKGATARNLGAPTGDLADSGYQFQGQFGNYLGTPIAPEYFITAGHIGGATTFQYNSTTYSIDTTYGTGGFVDDPASDLRIWKVTTPFSTYAPLYLGGDETNKALVVYGRGTDRGAEVRVPDSPTGDLRGWLNGTNDTAQSWGENVVSEVFTGEPDEGDLIRFEFDFGAGPNEGHLSGGDSGGGLFIEQSGAWKLAGINYAVDGYSRTGTNGSGFLAAIFNQNGLYVGSDEGGWTLVTTDMPGSSYATRISSNLDFIAANAPGALVPEPAGVAVLMTVGLILCRRARKN